MIPDVQNRCDRLVALFNELDADDRWDDRHVSLAIAGYYTTTNAELNLAHLNSCLDLLHSKEGFFSKLRGVVERLLVSKMATAEDPEAYLEAVESAYQLMKSHLNEDERVVVAAIILADQKDANIEELVNQTKQTLKTMKRLRWTLDSGRNVPLAALVAVTDKDVKESAAHAERAFKILEARLVKADKSTLEAMACILALYDQDVMQSCDLLCELMLELKKSEHSFGDHAHSIILAALVDSLINPQGLAQVIGSADDYLKTFEAFKSLLDLDQKTRRVYAALCVQSGYDQKQASRSALVNVSVQLPMMLGVLTTIAMVPIIGDLVQ